MRITVVEAPAHEVETEALILAVTEKAGSPGPWEELDRLLGGIIGGALGGYGFSGKAGQVCPLPTYGRGCAREVVLVGLGPRDRLDLEAWRRAVASGCTAARSRGARRAAVAVPPLEGLGRPELAGAAAEAAILACYRYREYKEPADDETELEEVAVATPGRVGDAVDRARAVAQATCWARDLVNMPGNAKRTAMLADMARAEAEARGLRCEILDAERCARLGLNALLAVGSGSDAAPALVILEHLPAGAGGDPVVLVGKGVTFDSGGLSIKPSKDMDEMKADMAGAAAVFAAMRCVAELQLQRHVVGVAPLAENLPGASSYRPGDIIRAYGGTTVEVINTDAEGRLILGDALAYARERYAPACIVDLATLTGACVVALGTAAAGLMGNDETLCQALNRAGEATGERLWPLPLWDAYDELIDSEVAKVKNSAGRDAGAITAAKFLQRFVGETPWAHLDIAGTAYLTRPTPYQPKGATGFGVRLLVEWLRQGT